MTPEAAAATVGWHCDSSNVAQWSAAERLCWQQCILSTLTIAHTTQLGGQSDVFNIYSVYAVAQHPLAAAVTLHIVASRACNSLC